MIRDIHLESIMTIVYPEMEHKVSNARKRDHCKKQHEEHQIAWRFDKKEFKVDYLSPAVC